MKILSLIAIIFGLSACGLKTITARSPVFSNPHFVAEVTPTPTPESPVHGYPPPRIPEELNLDARVSAPFTTDFSDAKVRTTSYSATITLSLPRETQLKLTGLTPEILSPKSDLCTLSLLHFDNPNEDGISKLKLVGEDPLSSAQDCNDYLAEISQKGAVLRFTNVPTTDDADGTVIPVVTLNLLLK